jgi:iron complex transport system permease protein
VWLDAEVLATLVLGDGPARSLGLHASTAHLSNPTFVVWTLRLPRVLVGVLVGANLAVAGAVFQAITRNELASPYVLGISSGAGLAVLLVLTVAPTAAGLLPVAASLGGAAAFLLVYAVAWRGGTSPVRLVLAGVVVATVGQSLQTGLFYLLDNKAAVSRAIEWTTGSLTGVGWTQVHVATVPTLVVLPLLLLVARQIDVLLLGERTASGLGMPVEYVRFGVASLAIVATAAAVAVAGLVSFIGLVVPHVVRTVLGGNDQRRLLVGCLFAGPALVVAADVVARLALSPLQLPVGIITGLLGGPYFLYLLRRADPLTT